MSYANYLCHHGRKGMKWYQHIYGEYQDHAEYASKSGKKSKSGKADVRKMSDEELQKITKRYGQEKAAEKALADPRKERQIKKLGSGEQLLNKGGSLASEVSKISDVGQHVKERKMTENRDISQLTNKQLQDLITRTNLERQYHTIMNAQETQKGKITTKEIIETVGSVAKVGATIFGIAKTIKELRG